MSGGVGREDILGMRGLYISQLPLLPQLPLP